MGMTFIDFFAGIGGFHSGFEKAGMKCIGWCEFDKYAQKSYRAIYDTEGLWFKDDVRKVRGWELPGATVWTFGFPCQDVSIAGKQKGIKRGTRSGLFFEIMRLLDEAEENKPRWIIAENVKNLLSIEGGWGFFTVLSEMAERGYSVEWRVYNSKNYGVPQSRERVYIVGYLGKTGGRELLPKSRKSERAIKQVIGGAQGERVYEPNLSCTLSSQGGGSGAKTGLYRFIDFSKKDTQITECSRCLTARYDRGISNRAGESSGVMAVLTPDRAEKRRNGRRFKEISEPAFTLTAQDRHGIMIKNATKKGYEIAKKGDGVDVAYPNSDTRCGRVQNQLSNTVTTQNHLGVVLEDGSNCCIRKLTPKECWRLQGFTDEQYEKAAAVNSKSQLYKQAGNAVTVNVTYEVGKHIVNFAKGEDDE